MTLLKDVIDANAKIRKEYKDLDDREKDQKIFLFNVNEAQVVKLVDTRDLKNPSKETLRAGSSPPWAPN